MYAHFYNLTAEPFRLSPDHRFCYAHAQYYKAKAYMAYAFLRAEGFVMVTGCPGTGKTTLIGDLIESLADENVLVATLVSTQLAADDLLRMVSYAFGLAADATEKSQVLQQLTARFLSLHREGGRALLIVDEAQDLSAKAMEELRLLTNLQQDGKPLLQIFLLGQPELRELIHDSSLEQVHQRIIAASHLEALQAPETREYVEHRLNVVGWRNDPAISSAVFPIIHLFSEGVPRRINLICSRLFLQGCVEQSHRITVADARRVVAELQDEQLSTRNLLHDDVFLAPDAFDAIPWEDLAPQQPIPSEPPPQKPPEPASHATGEAPAAEPGPDKSAARADPLDGGAGKSRESPKQEGESAARLKSAGSKSSDRDAANHKAKPAPAAKGKTANPGDRQGPVPAFGNSGRAWLWSGLLALVVMAVLAVYLFVDQSAYEALVEAARQLYVTLVTELERGWCRLSATC